MTDSYSDQDLTLRQHHTYGWGEQDGRFDTEESDDPDEYLAREERSWKHVEADETIDIDERAYWYGYLHGATSARDEMSPGSDAQYQA